MKEIIENNSQCIQAHVYYSIVASQLKRFTRTHACKYTSSAKVTGLPQYLIKLASLGAH